MSNPYEKYAQNAVFTADSGKLALMLYAGALKFTRQAITCLNEKNIPQTHNNIIKAEEILKYLLSTVDTGLEIGRNLATLYDYMYNRLIEANVKKDASILEEVAGFLEEISSAWQEAIDKV